MLNIALEGEVGRRLGAFLRSRGGAVIRSNHWEHFGALNRIAVDEGRSLARVDGGAGFDGTFELNFRGRTVRERLGFAWRALRGRDEERLHRESFLGLWPDGAARLETAARALGEPMTPQKVLACHYFALLAPHLERASPKRYLEIGAGTGYLGMPAHPCRLPPGDRAHAGGILDYLVEPAGADRR